MRSFSVSPSARAEVREGTSWFEEQRAGLGEEFAADVKVVLERIKASPRFHTAPIASFDGGVVRREFVDRFGYVVVFVETDTQRRVIMVRRGSTDPARWKSRV